MLQRLRLRAQGQEGFTLIELLVVILIIGILAAVAIPTFLAQTGKAKDANVQSNLNTIQLAESTYNTSNSGYTTNITTLGQVETTITQFKPAASLSSSAGTGGATDPNATSTTTVNYSATIVSPSGVTYSLTSWSDGYIADTCSVPSGTNAGACTLPSSNTSGYGNGTWGNGNV